MFISVCDDETKIPYSILDEDTVLKKCVQCPANMYRFSEENKCISCSSFKSAHPGSTSKGNCVKGRKKIVMKLTTYWWDK